MSIETIDQPVDATPAAAPVGPQFVHLRVHTEYSIVDGLVRIDDMIKAAVKDKQGALAITDLANMFAMVRFYKAARGKGIKPIVGVDAWITNDENRDKPHRIMLFAKNRMGYLQLCELLSEAWLTNQYKGRAEIRTEWLRERANKDYPLLPGESGANALIALSGAHFGDIGQAIENGNLDLAEANARKWAEIFPNGHFYVEIQRAGQANQEVQVRQSVALAAKLGLPVVATHPVQFLSKDEFIAHEARVCIAEGEMLANAKRVKRFNEQMRFLTQAEMAELFHDLPAALQNSVEIAKRCNVTLTLGKPQLPNFPTPGMSIDEFLVAETQKGLEERLVQLFPDPEKREKERPRYEARLKFENDTIIKMKFPGYFLIVAEFIQWGKNNGVPIGPGRGSGAGSLVAYALKITDLDPLKYNLLFERFLNPERISMPDFDIDFCQEKRELVIQHVKDLYGRDAVSQIATFGTMAAKGAIRDVGRVMDFGYNFCDGVSKLIPFKPGKPVSIAEAIEEEPLLKERQENEEEVRQLLDLAQQVEGITRNIGMHAGGVLIAPGKLTDFCPLYTQGGDAGVVSQYDKDDVEAVGLVKFDFLGLTTLTILDRAVNYIKDLDPEGAKDFDLAKLPLNDRPTYELLTKAKTVAVFQLESRGMQGMLKDARPDRFEDIIALVALYRPGPMDLIPDFCKRKHGEKFDYPDPRTEGILSETYGIMVYQEQVMQMAQIIGGYSLGGADMLRRAMGKKKAEEMAEHREIFRKGAQEGGLTIEKADEIFDLMEKFAGYGFNKSHAAAYALLSYHTAYLKHHHTAAFMAANMSLAMDDTEKVKILVEDSIDVCGLTILPPDVNQSSYRFRPDGEPGKKATKIRYGMGGVKGAGQNAIEAIIAAREAGGPFTSLFDFCKRVDKKQINRRTIEALIRSGAFDCFGVDRAVLFASVGFAMEYADQEAKSANQVSLFGGDDSDLVAPPDYVQATPWTDREKLAEEKIALGYYLSGHMFDSYQQEARRFARTKLSELEPSREPRMMCGVISGIRTQMTQRGKLLIVTLDDKTAVVEVTVYNEVFEPNKHMFKEDEFLCVTGKVSEDRFSGGLRISAEKVYNITAARIQFGRQIGLALPKAVPPAKLAEILGPHRDEYGLPVSMRVKPQGIDCVLQLGDDWRVAPSDALKIALEQGLGAQEVAIEY